MTKKSNSTQLEAILQRHQWKFKPVVPFSAASDKLVAMDLSAANTDIPQEPLQNLPGFIAWVNDHLSSAGSRYAIGGYGEYRNIYSESPVFGKEGSAEEPRKLHLGTDIWGKPFTPVSAPIDGLVHSFAFNDGFGDYGATVILCHRMDDLTFHTLYGHLSLRSLGNLLPGQRIAAGEIFAEFGIPSENGQWPPHLHFQLISDLEDHTGDYPGVCRYSEKEKYLRNCPDPDLVLQMNRYLG